jgi:hypothetical protein
MNHPPRNIDMTCFSWVKLVLKTDLPSQAKFLGLYLSTYMNLNQDMAFPSLKRIEGETGLAHATVLKYMGVLVEEGWLIKQSGNAVTSNRYWINIPNITDIRVGQEATYVNSGEKVGHRATSNNNRITNTIHKGFTPPSLQEVQLYTASRQVQIDAERFIDFYQSKGWLIGKNKMKDWQAAVRNWEKGNANTKNTTGQPINQRKLSGAERTRLAREAAYERQRLARSSDLGCVEPN